MGSRLPPSTPPSTAITLSPLRTMVTIRLRPRGELVATPSPSAPTTASGLPPLPGASPPTAAVSTPPSLVFAGAVDGEMMRTPRSAPSAATRAIARLAVSPSVSLGEGDSEADEEGPRPPLPIPTSGNRFPRSEDIGRTAVPASAVSWGDLPADLVLSVAYHLRFVRQDIERMRAVCPAWREVIPSTLDPVLVLSRKTPDVQSEIILLEISRSRVAKDAVLKRKIPLVSPPTSVSCWGSALGLAALQSVNDGEISAYCICCAESKQMLSLPIRTVPKALFLEPLTPQRFVLMDTDAGAQSVLRIDGDGFPWAMESGGRWWLPTPGFGDVTLKSMALLPGVLRAGASQDSIIIIDESGRPMDAEIGLQELPSPPL